MALLAVVAGQDVEADPAVPGRWRIARRVAPGRVISTVDPEARHARKSRSQRRDGYKTHICAEPDTGLITAAELTTANTSDAQVGPRLLQQDPTAPHNTAADTDTDSADDTDTDTDTDSAAVGDVGAEGFVGLVLADSAYASGEALDAFAAAGYDTAIKPIDAKPRITGGFTRDNFTIDTDAVGAHNSVVGADQGFRAPSGDQESVRDSGHEDSASAPIAAGQRPRQSFRHPQGGLLGLLAAGGEHEPGLEPAVAVAVGDDVAELSVVEWGEFSAQGLGSPLDGVVVALYLASGEWVGRGGQRATRRCRPGASRRRACRAGTASGTFRSGAGGAARIGTR